MIIARYKNFNTFEQNKDRFDKIKVLLDYHSDIVERRKYKIIERYLTRKRLDNLFISYWYLRHRLVRHSQFPEQYPANYAEIFEEELGELERKLGEISRNFKNMV